MSRLPRLADSGNGSARGSAGNHLTTWESAARSPPAEEDAVAHEHDVLRERCLLFVAATRARDALRVSYVDRASPFLTAPAA
ncbi:hypothetical protein GCM10010185_11900 [Saccharothrix coeruleofusca]|uniref:UvrD-like helicase family protein n=1 Tax=Saccharothrix coeruleofusca TaxID=33919 RepID=A0A918AIT2_9PSEU|nr:hypothetical protein GCM10010185_11900 [Saccharothrix coeruleofusca]